MDLSAFDKRAKAGEVKSFSEQSCSECDVLESKVRGESDEFFKINLLPVLALLDHLLVPAQNLKTKLP